MERFSLAPVTHFARTNARNDRRIFGIKQRDRLSHMYVIGKTGTGKSTLLERVMLSDVEAGRGLALVDPHGDLAERIASQIPAHRKDDLIYLNVPDRSQPFGYNPLKRVTPERRPLAGSGLLEVFEKMWPEAWGVRMEHILRNALLALLDQPQASLPDVLKLLSDKRFRKEALPGRLRRLASLRRGPGDREHDPRRPAEWYEHRRHHLRCRVEHGQLLPGRGHMFAPGDRLALVNEDPADATLADLSITLKGSR